MVRSVDMQQVLSQTNSIERVQQVQQQHPDIQQRYFEDQLNKERKQLKEKVKNSQEVEHLSIKEEERRKGWEKKSKDKRAKKGKTGENDIKQSVDEPGGRVDIRV